MAVNKLTAALLWSNSSNIVLGNHHQIGNEVEFQECEMCQLLVQLSLTPSVAIGQPLDINPWKALAAMLQDPVVVFQ